jgi:hypothetical protein
MQLDRKIDNAKQYSFYNLINQFKWLVRALLDKRTGLDTIYSIEDAVLSVFSVFFMQFPLFLAHQIKMEEVVMRKAYFK